MQRKGGESMLWAGSDLSRYILILLAVYGLLALIGAVRRSWRERTRAKDEKPFISILVIAHNDEDKIEGVLRWLLGLDYLDAHGRPNFEVVVVSAGACDQTPAIAERLAREFSTLTAVSVSPGAEAYEEGIARCRGEVICLMDLAKQAPGRAGRAVTRILS